MINFSNVSKVYASGAKALASINLKIDDGEMVFLVGASGSGKTTMLRLLIRDLIASSGNLFVDEKDLATLKPNELVNFRRKMGFVFQDLKLLPNRSIFENIALSLEVLGKKDAEIKEEVGKVLKMVNLDDYGAFFPAQLSGGELQRVAIARALLGEPKIIIADEPTANVDPATAWAIMKLLDDENKKGVTVIISTHNTDVVDTLKRRVIRLESGRIVKDGKGKYR